MTETNHFLLRGRGDTFASPTCDRHPQQKFTISRMHSTFPRWLASSRAQLCLREGDFGRKERSGRTAASTDPAKHSWNHVARIPAMTTTRVLRGNKRSSGNMRPKNSAEFFQNNSEIFPTPKKTGHKDPSFVATLGQIGRREKTRTSDPHHVKVVL